MANTSNHPPRKDIPIKPHRGGRKNSKTFFLTDEELQGLQAILAARGLSANDWLAEKIKADRPD